jgi:hypothetical protein
MHRPLRDREAVSPAHHAIAPSRQKAKIDKKESFHGRNVMLVVKNAMRGSPNSTMVNTQKKKKQMSWRRIAVA